MDNYNNGNNYGGGNNNNNRNDRNGNNNKKPKNVNLIVFIIIAAVITFIGITMLNSLLRNATYKEISYNEFIEMVNNDEVESVSLEQDRILITPTESAQESNGVNKLGYTYYTGYVNDDSLVPLLKRKGIEFTGYIPDSSSSIVEFLVAYVLPFLFIYVIFAFVYRRISKGGGMMGGMGVGKSTAKVYVQKKTGVTFKDVAGLDEEKEDLEEIVSFLKNPGRFVKVGARIPKGVLLVGPPGTGKTLMAKAVAGEAGVPFFSISGSDFVEMFVGVGASRVRDLFDEAKKNAPCIIFIDEIDAVARQRGTGLGGGHDEREQTLNQLLVEMDGFGVNEGIIVLAATNRVDILDHAILRPGRFDRKVFVNRPDVKGREEILKVHTKNKPLAEDVNLNDIARTTAGFAGADLENLMNEAAICAAKDNRAYIVKEDVDKSFIKVGIGGEKKSRLVPESERRITAYHESGHAILFHLLPHVGPVYTVSIIPTGTGAGGYTMPLPENDNVFMTKAKMLEDIKVSLGGRIAEELILEDITTGASQDIKQASQYARAMVTKYGMSEKLGLINYESDDQEEVFLGRDLGHAKNYSEKVAGAIDKEVKRIIDECYADARAILEAHEDILHKCAALLLEKERIDRAEFEALFDDVPNANSTANAEPSTI